MSRIVIEGNFEPCCVALFDGDDETPSPSASMATTKYCVVSTMRSGPKNIFKSPLVPLYHVKNRTALLRLEFSAPNVRYPTLQFSIARPLSSEQRSNCANCKSPSFAA